MRRRCRLLIALVALIAVLGAFSSTAVAATSATNTKTVLVTGTTSSGGTFTGTFTITKFAVQNGQVVAIGTLTGTLTDEFGNISTVTQQVAFPVSFGQHSCTILELTLGPVTVGQVQLDAVGLTITTQPGSGNVLGNLLCQIAGLLDRGASLSAVVDKLNQVLKRI
jgi:hypothetical protein